MYRELKEIVDRMISPEYQGRGLIELLQNAHDAHSSRSADGRVEIVLDEQEGEHGVLYVANGGRPFTTRNFNALCSIGRSSKRPEEGIGHKGVGFKSILHFSEAPELYSVAQSGSKIFDGYCFRFALPEDIDRLAEQIVSGVQDPSGLLLENLPRLRVPVVLEAVPETVRRFGPRGFVTVVRVPLRSTEAREAARAQIRELMDGTAPFELFLDRLVQVTLDIRSESGRQRKRYDRGVRPLYGFRGLKVQEITLRGRMRLIVVRARVDEELARDAIAPNIRDGSMSADWTALEKKAEVCVAVPAGEPLPDGRLYAFLPMGTQAPCPIPGFVHAPFFVELNRRSFHEANPWNDLLLDTAATACARAVLLASEGRVDVPAGTLVDLMCWAPTHLDRLGTACEHLGEDLDGIPFMPVLAPSGERTSLEKGYLWKCPDSSRAFTPTVLAAIGTPNLIDPGLQPVRRRRLLALAEARRCPLPPPRAVTLSWAEQLAAAMQRDEFDADRWADYYADLSESFPDGTPLSGKKIILTSEETLAPAGHDAVFLEPGRAESPTLPTLPDGLSGKVSFLHGAIDRSARRGKRRPTGLRWLRSQRLAHAYEPESVLRAVSSVMQQDGQDEDARHQCLLYAYAVSGTLSRPPKLANFPVPVRDGWLNADQAMFGRGWPGKEQLVDDTLVRFLEGIRDVPVLRTTAKRLLRSADQICADTGISADAMRRFLEHQGVHHGLRPRYEPFRGSVRGSALNRPRFFAGMSNSTTRAGFRNQWRDAALCWPGRSQVAYDTVDYHPARTQLPVLPGQHNYDAFDYHSRRLYAELIVHGLATWGDTDLEMRFVRSSDRSGTRWPTPLAVFLTQEEWIPQTPVGTDDRTFAAADTAWWWSSEQPPPDYVGVVTAALRRRHTPRVLDRLRLLGIRSWDDPKTASDRVEELPALVHRHPHLRTGVHRYEVSREYEKAWAELLPVHEPATRAGTMAPSCLLLSRANALELHEEGSEEGETVYVPDPQGVQEHKLLERAPVPVLPIMDKALGRRIVAFLQARSHFEVRCAGEAELDISVGVLPARQAPRKSLVGYVGAWLKTLVAAVVDLDEERASRPDPVLLPDVDRLLQACVFTVTQDLVIWIAGHRVEASDAERCLLYQDPDEPCLVIRHTGALTPWHVLRHAATAISTLIGTPYLAAQLRTALSELADRCHRTEVITDGDVAAALGIPLGRLELVVADRASRRSGSAQLLPLLACVDIDGAEELRRRMESFKDRAELREWLASRLDPRRADMLLGLLDDDDRARQLDALNVPLATANRAWRTLGLPVIDNRAGHHRQFEAWLEQERPALQERVRDAFAPVFRSGGDLSEYVRLRELPGLAPDADWHTTYWNLSSELLIARADSWVATHTPTSPRRPTTTALRPLVEVREGAIAAIHTHLPRLRALVEEWAQHTGRGEESLPDASEIIQEQDGDGLLDFEIPSARSLANWLSELGHWPAGMPVAHRRADLALEKRKPPIPAQRPGPAPTSGPGHATAAPPSGLVFNGTALPIQRDDLRELAHKVGAGLTTEQLATPAREVAGLAPRAPRPQGSGHQGTGGGLGGRVTPADPDATTAVGLAGEAVVARWLQEQFGVPPEVSWKSSLRRHVLAGTGDDHLGYDFRIHEGGRTYLFEVKSSVGSSGRIILGDSEVARASRLAPHETYTIVYVSDVLDDARRRITPLPNPFSAPNLAGYELVSTKMTLRFDLTKG
ncbi:DUF3883 domain-containing protein [Streptomyces sp. NBC_01799]|uniref:sacsin N-terminal ATP-binding-like domain-containing protein n=1 Tax=Streptomyces sp. NBC_01800 TaxID=2975945 RepID=UPI002DD7EFBC|nr:DUF3883 domain-containing protein [Streptomyces sp. NBC_01800]WSA72700.1 DUF3883 domain-containing protein [Streptomyces sp. NBC_01800]WSA81227.1 DUF3883 domain-containing protein [Streptomyces sp. NBC_01799]